MAHIGPFPGPDPWLEERWAGVHHLLIGFCQAQLNRQLRSKGLIARIDERVYVESLDTSYLRSLCPDIYVAYSQPQVQSTTASSDTAVLDERFVIEVPDESASRGYIEIVDATDQAKVVTAVEILSPTNKVDSRARAEYERKLREYWQAQVNTVEIDLIRDGLPIGGVSMDLVPVERRTPYRVWVYRAWKKPNRTFEYYRVSIRRSLPTVWVPLRETDEDVSLNLQAAYELAYEQGCYDLTDYSRPLDPPLSAEDAEWAKERIERWRNPPAP